MRKITNHTPPTHEKHQEPHGLMPQSVCSSAMWQFVQMAHIAIDKMKNQKTLEGETDRTVYLTDIADSVMGMYNLPRRDEGGFETLFTDELITKAWQEARRCNLPWDSHLTEWLRTGGKKGNELTREPIK